MSFMDNPMMGLLFGHTQYAMNKRREQYAEERGLLDDRFLNREAQIANNPMAQFQPVTETVNNETGQTFLTGGEQMYAGQPPGLLADAMTPAQYQLARERLGAKWFGAKHAQAMDTQRLSNQGAMAKHMTPGAGDIIAQQNALHDDMMQGAAAYRQEMAPYTPALDNADYANALMAQKGGITNLSGVDQYALLMRYARTVKPEAVTDSDYQDIMDAFGLKGTFSQKLNFLKSGGVLEPGQLTDVVNAINQMANESKAQVRRINQYHEKAASNRGYTPYYLRPVEEQGRYQGANPEITDNPRYTKVRD